ncbi:addiction module antidote protein [Vibrio parahaemolyticus]
MRWNELIKSKMKKSGITQSDLAELMGVAQGTIGRYINAQREPSLGNIAEMMKHVGLSHIVLLNDGSVSLTDFDPSKCIETPEDIAEFMQDAFNTGDQTVIANAFGVVAKAVGMSDIAAKTGLSREQLYRSFSENGNPTLKTMLAVMSVLGVSLTAQKSASVR